MKSSSHSAHADGSGDRPPDARLGLRRDLLPDLSRVASRTASRSPSSAPPRRPGDDPPTPPHGYQGGDLVGVLEHLDYLTDLGVNAIYFTPVFQSASNHRYHTHDYYRVDPMLGEIPRLRRLIDGAHARGMKVVLDGVFNHASRGFFQFHDILENGQDSAYLDWFTVHGWPMNAYNHDQAPTYSTWWGLHALPKFNTRTPAVREFLWGVGRHWIEFGTPDGAAARQRPTRSMTDRSGPSSAGRSTRSTPGPTSSGRSGRSAPSID